MTALVLGACVLGYSTYRSMNAPTTLTVAAGSFDADAVQLISAIGARLTETNSGVRLKILDKPSMAAASQAFAARETDLALVRTDVGGLSAARSVLIMGYGVVLVVVPPGSLLDSMDDLKSKTVGVVGLEMNKRLVDAISTEYELGPKTEFRDLSYKDLRETVQAKRVQAVIAVLPIGEKYISLLRNGFLTNAKKKVGLLPIESAASIAAKTSDYESFELPKGTIHGYPAVPDEDFTTLRIPFYLVANKDLDDDLVGHLAKAIMDVRRDVSADNPLAAKISAPSTEPDVSIPTHPGAAAYFKGEQKTFFDRYGDMFFYTTMLLGTFTSVVAAAWSFISPKTDILPDDPASRLYDLHPMVKEATSSDLDEIEEVIDNLIQSALAGKPETHTINALSLATRRLESLISRRRQEIRGHQKSSTANHT